MFGFFSRRRPPLRFHHHHEVDQFEWRFIVRPRPVEQKLERRLGIIILEATTFQLLDLFQQLSDFFIRCCQVYPQLFRFSYNITFTGLVGYYCPLAVAHLSRVGMLISIRPLGYSIHVVAGFVAEGAGTDVRGIRVGREIGKFAYIMCYLGQRG